MNRTDLSILVVDDVNSMRVQVREILKSLGFTKVWVSASADDAIVKLSVDPVHLIVADWHMPGKSGLELLHFVRANPELEHVAFVFLTGESTRDGVIQAIQAGVDDFIIKPATISQIQAKVFNALIKRNLL
jgi:two-component system chemotaxis response regulator CheY